MNWWKELSLILIIGCFAVLAETEKPLEDTPLLLNEQDVRLLINPVSPPRKKNPAYRPQSTANIAAKPYPNFPFGFYQNWAQQSYPPYLPYPASLTLPTLRPTTTTERPTAPPTRPCKKPCKPPASKPPFYAWVYPPKPTRPYYAVVAIPPKYVNCCGIIKNGTESDDGISDGSDKGNNNNKGNNLLDEISKLLESLHISKQTAEDEQTDYNYKNEAYAGKINPIDVSNTAEPNKPNDPIMFDTKDIKLPFDIQLDSSAHPISNPANKKFNHQEALVYLKNYRKAREVEAAETAAV